MVSWCFCWAENKKSLFAIAYIAQRSIVVKYDQESYLTNGLRRYASEMEDEITCFDEANVDESVEHMVVEITDQGENNASFHNEDHNQVELNKIMRTSMIWFLALHLVELILECCF